MIVWTLFIRHAGPRIIKVLNILYGRHHVETASACQSALLYSTIWIESADRTGIHRGSDFFIDMGRKTV